MPKKRYQTIKRTAKKLKKQVPRLLKPKQSFSNRQLLIFALIFALVGGYAIWKSLAATATTQTWDSQADFQTGSLASTTATTDGHLTLNPTTTGGGGGGRDVLEAHLYPQNGTRWALSDGRTYAWAIGSSPNTPAIPPGSSATESARYNRTRWGSEPGPAPTWHVKFDTRALSEISYFTRYFDFHQHGGGVGYTSAYATAFGAVDYLPAGLDNGAFLGGPKTNHTKRFIQFQAMGGGTYDPTIDWFRNVTQRYFQYEIDLNTWYSFDCQFRFDVVNGYVNCKVNGQQWIDYTGPFGYPGALNYGGTQGQAWFEMLEGGYEAAGSTANQREERLQFTLSRWGQSAAAVDSDNPTMNFGDHSGPIVGGSYPASSLTDTGTTFGSTSTSTTTYPSIGSVVLSKDALVSSNWSNLTASDSKPSGTNITYDARTSTDNVNWSAYNTNPANLPAGRYVQVRATLSTTNTSVTPSIDNISIDYSPVADTTPPTTPTGLTAGASDSTHVNLNWIAATDDRAVTNYNIYRNGSTAPLATVPAAPATVGNTAVGANRASMSSDWKYTNVYPLTTTSDISKLSFYVDGLGTAASGSQLFKGVIYAADSSGEPFNLLATSNQLTINHGDAAAWRDLVFPSLVHLNPGTYFIGVISGGTSGVAQDAYDLQTSILRTGTDTYADGPANPYGSATTANAQLSLYATGSSPTYTDPTVTANTTYTYQVAAVDAAGNQSPKTAAISITTPASAPPPPPPPLKAGDINGDTKVDFLDLSILVKNYNQTQPGTRATGDLNGDLKIDFLDLSILVNNWGK